MTDERSGSGGFWWKKLGETGNEEGGCGVPIGKVEAEAEEGVRLGAVS